MSRRALLVDPNVTRLDSLRQSIGEGVEAVACTNFHDARARLLTDTPEFLITRIRLGAFNGLHLAHLALSVRRETRCLLYDEPIDPHLAHEAQSIGAFCETTSRLHFAVAAYLRAPLPERDRRSSPGLDRRTLFRGGRRSSDRVAWETRGLSSNRLH
jgi:DNA-binding NtrC family response regulator